MNISNKDFRKQVCHSSISFFKEYSGCYNIIGISIFSNWQNTKIQAVCHTLKMFIVYMLFLLNLIKNIGK